MHTLLVIDDSPTVRKLVEISFARHPWAVFFAASGEQGLMQAKERRPDVILLDYVLPDMNGLDVCRQLTSQGAGSTRVVLMTAKEERVRTQFKEFPIVVDYVTKPFTPDSVVAKAVAALSRPNSRSEHSRADRSASALSQVGGLSDARQALAQGLYAVLRSHLGRIPELMRDAPHLGLGPYLARKLVAPEVVDELFEELSGLFSGPRGASSAASQQSVVSLLDVLDVLSRKKETGVLEVAAEGESWEIRFEAGVMLYISNRNVDRQLALAEAPDLEPLGAREQLRDDHKTGKTEILVSLRNAGLLTALQCEECLARVAAKAVPALDARRDWSSTWSHDLGLASSSGPLPRGLSLDQLRLETLRSNRPTKSFQLDSDILLRRTEGFSRRVRELKLDAPERMVLAVVTTPMSPKDIIAFTTKQLGGSDPSGNESARNAVDRILQIGLLEVAPRPTADRRRQRGVVCDPDAETRTALATLFADLFPQMDLAVFASPAELERSLQLQPSRLIVINASAAPALAAQIIADDRNREKTVRFVALLDAANPDLERELLVSATTRS